MGESAQFTLGMRNTMRCRRIVHGPELLSLDRPHAIQCGALTPIPCISTIRKIRFVWLFRMAMCGLLACGIGDRPLAAQTNFAPLERGDYTEQEEQLILIRGIDAGVDYAMRLTDTDAKNLPRDLGGTRMHQDVRLKLRTVMHRDISLHLTLEPEVEPFNDANVRREPASDRNRLPEGQQTGINAREVFLRYNFNPNSGLILGKHEVSLGDRRGKTFNAIGPGYTYDCRVGTWCMPFGGFRINDTAGDWVHHLALEYTGWESQIDGLRNAFEVEIFRLWYAERDVPLGGNLGPGLQSETPEVSDGKLATDDLDQPIFYDAHDHDYFGLRLNWETGAFFLNFDITSSQGSRVYHTYRVPGQGITEEMTFDDIDPIRRRREKIAGAVWESEIGYRSLGFLFGFRIMSASGDPERKAKNGGNFLRTLKGFWEITPGSYRGTRLYFNGTDSEVDGGAGLGHSVNNTRLMGIFLNASDPDGNKVGYAAGIYDLRFNHAIRDQKGKKRDAIGIEWDNMLTLYLHKSAWLQFEANLIQQGSAFRYDDYSVPDNKRELLVQGIARFVYQF